MKILQHFLKKTYRYNISQHLFYPVFLICQTQNIFLLDFEIDDVDVGFDFGVGFGVVVVAGLGVLLV